ncbi:hypothetical protein J4481_01970 [Candidatus Pacearchaeota archaeon]|nr:hypothetical protein [Candidatus Pacearchaeota archaeon]
MGWFNKNKKEEGIPKLPSLSRLPELPQQSQRNISLPQLPSLENQNSQMPFQRDQLQQLPSFPMSELGNRFSQNAIKEAVSGGEKGDGDFEADEFDLDDEEENQMMPLETPIKMQTEKRKIEIPSEFRTGTSRIRKAEPIFIRIDKFEESLHLFEKTKEKIKDIETLLGETKRIKEGEEKELEAWENEIQLIKNQIEKVNQDIFSKVE